MGPTALLQLAAQNELLPEKRIHPHICGHMKGVVVCFTGLRVKKELVS
jgi:hypothetical protein